MPAQGLTAVDEIGRRETARRFLDAAELWLRNTIDAQFLSAFGADYFSSQLLSGNPVIPKKIRDYVAARRAEEPARFSRDIDATTFGHCVTLVVHPNHYEARFKAALLSAYPDGSQEAHTFLERLEAIRNKCAHGGNVSDREVERAVCYSNDLIDSLKEFYVSQNKQRIYNVPTIVRVTDSLGNVIQATGLAEWQQKWGLVTPRKNELQIGQTLRIEAEIDATFDASEYEIIWFLSFSRIATGARLELEITMQHVTENLLIDCQVVSNKPWHRKGSHDDKWQLQYQVLPPLA